MFLKNPFFEKSEIVIILLDFLIIKKTTIRKLMFCLINHKNKLSTRLMALGRQQTTIRSPGIIL